MVIKFFYRYARATINAKNEITCHMVLKVCHLANLFKIFVSKTSSSGASCRLNIAGRALEVPINASMVDITEIAIAQALIYDTPLR